MNMDDMNNRMYDTHIILGHMGARAVRGVTMHAQRRSYYLSSALLDDVWDGDW